MKDPMGDRMKYYENRHKSQTMNGLPVIVRLDGKGFSTFTNRYKRPFETITKLTLTK